MTSQIQEVVGSTQELDKMAKELQELVGTFNLGEQSVSPTAELWASKKGKRVSGGEPP